ncbi:hypothetical protein KI387_009067, partial [Taxus chinensis]
PTAIVSYNHLGNNDGMNLSAPQTFRSKEISKSNVVDDMVSSNVILYGPGEHLDHVVVIKYVPYVGDSKRAMDEYTSEIFMGGKSTIVLRNTCEDSLLAASLILDLVLLAELSTRIQLKKEGEIPLFSPYSNYSELPHESAAGAAWPANSECTGEAEGHAGEHNEGMRWTGSREQHDPRVRVK